MKKCIYCETELRDMEPYCYNCGKPQPIQPPAYINPNMQNAQQNIPYSHIAPRRNIIASIYIWFWIVLLSVCILLLATKGFDASTILSIAMYAAYIFSLIKILQWRKYGFTIFLALSVVNVACALFMDLGKIAIVGLIPVTFLYLVLQLKRDGVSAWNLLH